LDRQRDVCGAPPAFASDATQEPNRRWVPYLNRELSWLEFVGRVLALAEDSARPLLERAKFLAISSQNLDYFFQVRVAGLKTQLESEMDVRSPDGRTPLEQLRAIRPQVIDLMRRQEDVFAKELIPALAAAGVSIQSWDDLSEPERCEASAIFDERIFAVLTPLSVDPAHPFPYISNLSLNLALVVRDPDTRAHRFARVKVPPLLPRLVRLGQATRFVPVEQIIERHIQTLFPGMDIVSCTPFRVTRDADLAIEANEADDLLLAVETGLRRRSRMNAATRLELPAGVPDQIRNLLTGELELKTQDVYLTQSLLDHGAFWELHELDRPDLKDEPLLAVPPIRFASPSVAEPTRSIFEVLRDEDVLVHHPYESFNQSVEAFLAEAAEDPAVLAIKHALYRTSGPDNPIVRTLAKAAELGKQVVTLVELKARFDEKANIEWARALEEAGVHVVYGQVGLKAHCKITLVVRQEADGIRRYCHVGTGNYNTQTARVYEDVGLLSCAEPLADDLSNLFNHLTGYSKQQDYRLLWVAPGTLRRNLLREIAHESEQRDGRIVIKANSLTDTEVIDALYAASQRSVEIDLIIRGICCLRAGIRGLSENIRVRSIVGRFLEHSRIFRFGSEARGARYYIGSSDLMKRNLDRRVEVITPVLDAALARRLEEILDVNLADDQLAWELSWEGSWRRARPERGVNVQRELLERARSRNQALATRETDPERAA
jgi:polyphosphate kinase